MNLTNVSSMGDLIQLTSQSTAFGGFEYYGILIIVMVFAISFMATAQNRKELSFIVALFFSFITSLFLAIIGILDPRWSYTVLALLLIAVGLLFMRGGGE